MGHTQAEALAAWQRGNMATWQHSKIAIWQHGNMARLQYGNMATDKGFAFCKDLNDSHILTA